MGFSAFERYVELGLVPVGAPLSIQPEDQNGDYESGVALIGSERWRIRTARVTPTKPGAFVAVWERGDAWSTGLNPQALRTQRAQSSAFSELQLDAACENCTSG